MPETFKAPYLQKDEMRGDYQVWIVDGAYIRGHIDEEFTNFGQHFRIPTFPKRSSGWIGKLNMKSTLSSLTTCWWNMT